MRLTFTFFALVILAVGADKKRPVTNEAGNENVDITANPLIDSAEINSAVGGDVPKGIIAIQVKIVPKGDYKMEVNKDDFVLLSHRDGQRSGPYSPSQIAGSTVMVVKTGPGGQGGGLARQRTGPGWGGIPGTGGRPRQIEDPTMSNTGVGTMPDASTKTTAEVKEDAGKPANPLLKMLETKMLPDVSTNEPVSGLLYFPIEGKLKTKDLELIYKGPAGRLYIDFK